MSIVFPLLLQVFLIFLNAVFACAEIAVISTNDAKIDKMVSEGNKKAKLLSRLKENPAKFLATIQIAITLSGFLGSAFAADNFAGYIVDLMERIGLANDANRAVFNSVAVILITLILSYFTLVFGELVPKRLAMKKSESMALSMSSPLYAISKLFTPVVWLLTVSTNGILRLFGVNPNEEEEEVSEEDIRLMVDASSEQGAIDIEEKKMIQNVFEFDDMSVDEFSTHRTEISFLNVEDSDAEWENTIFESSHSAFPVCGETVDDILGVIFAREYFRAKDKSRENLMKNVMKPAYFVPSNLKADVLFKQMKQTGKHFAVVLDEYGGVTGIVTMNDILEQIVGDFNEPAEEKGEDLPDIMKNADGTWTVSGSASLDDVNEALSLKLSSEECDTFGGYVFGEYGSLPEDGSVFEIDIENAHVSVVEIKEHRIEKTVVTVKDTGTDEN